MGNPITWVELTTYSPDGAKEFYSKLFDWKITEFPNSAMPYQVIDTGTQPGGGIMGLPEPGIPTEWMMYINVEDINATCDRLTELGGKVWKGPMEIPKVGWLAVVCDPQGAYFGLWQPKK